MNNIKFENNSMKYLTDDTVNSITCAIVGFRLDYANTVLVDVSPSNIIKLQRLQNTLACIATRQHGYNSTSQSLATLHWCSIKWQIDFKGAIIACKLFSTGQPFYLASSISPHAPAAHSGQASPAHSTFLIPSL